MSSYIVLARKWRPKVFEEVSGQDHVTRTLQNALKNNRLAHALLFCGARGVGKTTVARILSRAINCPNRTPENNQNPCNVCDICIEILSGASVDIIEIDGASNRGIDEIRQIRENIKFYPVRTKFKVYIIDEVHMLTKEAFNALLKTLEEPPKHIYFIMATTEPQKIPPTILSRCQRYDFRKLTLKELFSHLKNIIKKENLEITDEAINIISREAGGSVRDAMSLLDKIIAFGAFNEDDVCNVLGISGISSVKEAVLAILNGDIKGSMELIERLDSFGADYNKFLNDMILILRDLLLIKKLGNDSSEVLDFYGDYHKEPLKIAEKIPSEHILLLITQIMDGLKEMPRSNIPKISMEILFMKLCFLDQLVSVDEILKRFDEMTSCGDVSVISPKINSNEKENSHHELDGLHYENLNFSGKKNFRETSVKTDKDARSKKTDFIGYLRQKNQLIASILSKDGALIISEDGTIEINPQNDFLSDFITDRENIDKIQEIAREFFNREVNIKVKSNDKSKSLESPESKGEWGKKLDNTPGEIGLLENSNLKDAVKENPFVKKAMEIFSARIINVEKKEKSNNNLYLDE